MDFDYKVMLNGVIGQEVDVGKGYSLFLVYRADAISKVRNTTAMDICIKYNGELIINEKIHADLEFKDFGVYCSRDKVKQVFAKMKEFVK